MQTIQPLRISEDNEWIIATGRYILNMGAVEAASRVLIGIHERADNAAAMNADLPSRLGFLRSRFPRTDSSRHSWAMNVFAVAARHVGFRNIVAHSPLIITGFADGSKRIEGILNLTPNDEKNVGEFVGIEELRGRVEESATLGDKFLQMQADFGREGVA